MKKIRRRIDDLGRLTIPSILRQQLGIQAEDYVSIEVEKGYIKVIPEKSIGRCAVTGFMTEDIEIVEGVPLSPEGKRILRERLNE